MSCTINDSQCVQGHSRGEVTGRAVLLSFVCEHNSLSLAYMYRFPLFFFKSPYISRTSNTMSWMTTIRFTCKFQHPRVLATVALLDWNLQIFIFFNSARYPFQQLVNRSRNFFKELIRTGGECYYLPFTFFSRNIFFLDLHIHVD